MVRALLQSKLHRPRLAQDFVHRPRLDVFLTKLSSAKVMLISAPPGYGKSSLAVSWLAQAERNNTRTAWLTLDSSDNDLVTFWSYLTGAIESAFREACPQTRHLLATPNAATPGAVARSLAGECQLLSKQLMVVIDEYDRIEDTQVHEAMHEFIRYMPATLRLIFTTRTEPHATLGLLQWRLQGHAIEVRAADLEFTLDETKAFFQAMNTSPVPSEVAEALQRQVEGWAAGLRMAAMSLHGRDGLGMREYLREFAGASNRYVVDYLVDHVLALQPAHIQWFLLRSSVLPRFSAQLCATALGDMPPLLCQETIESLDRTNLFVINLDEHRGWYRYHSQFRAVLQQRLRASVGEASMAAIRRRAGEWFADHDEFSDAIAMYVEAGDNLSAAQILTKVVAQSNIYIEWPRLERWLHLFPPDYIDSHAGLALTRAWVMTVAVPPRDAEPSIKLAERLLGAVSNPDAASATLQGHIQILRGVHQLSTASNLETNELDAALDMLPANHIWPRIFALSKRSQLLMFAGRLQDVQQDLLNEIARTPPNEKVLLLELHFLLAFFTLYCGSIGDTFERASTLYRIAVALNDAPKISIALILKCISALQRNDLAAASAYLEQATSMMQPWDTQLMLMGTYLQLLLHAYADNAQGSAQVLQHLREWSAYWGNTRTQRVLLAYEAFHQVHHGDITKAYQWAYTTQVDATPSFSGDDFEAHVMLDVLTRISTPDSLARADELTVELTALYRAKHVVHYQMIALMWQTWVRQLRGNTAGALDALEEAVTIGGPRGYLRWFLEGGPIIQDLLQTLVSQNRHAKEASAVLREIDDQLSQPPAQEAQTAGQSEPDNTAKAMPNPLADALTERESDVLALLAQKLTNKEIGGRLGLSPITVRNHASRIYAKLQVTTRRQAVHKAHDLGLLA